MSMLLTLLDHARWADTQAIATISAIDPERPQRAEATRLYAHLAGADGLWLARIEGRPSAVAVWPELTLDAAAALASESLDAMRAIVASGAGGLGRVVAYRTSAGDAYRSTVAEIITHVALHGSYHRGQIAILARQGDAAPAMTDLIVYMRSVAPSTV